MLKKSLIIGLCLSTTAVVAVPVSIGIKNTIAHNHQSRVFFPEETKPQLLNLDYVFYNDLKQYRDDNYLDIHTKIDFEQNCVLIVWGNGELRKDSQFKKEYTFLNSIKINQTKNEFYCDVFPTEFTYRYKIPGGPTNALLHKWPEKDVQIWNEIPTRLNCKIVNKKMWYGQELDGKLKSNNEQWINVKNNPTYHNKHPVPGVIFKFESKGRYKGSNIDKEIKIKYIDNKNIHLAFLDNKKLSFNYNLTLLINLYKAYQTVVYLYNFILDNTFKGVWTNQIISKQEVINNLKNILDFKFKDYFELDSLVKKYDKNEHFDVDGDFHYYLNLLRKNLIKMKLIKEDELLNLVDFGDFYKAVLLFFKNNQFFLCDQKNKEYQFWNRNDFQNKEIIEKLPKTNWKLLKVKYVKHQYGFEEINHDFETKIN